MNDRLHKSIYGQTLDEMKEDKGAWEYEQEPSSDAISRQAVLKIIDGWYENNRDTENIEDLIILITYMASVKQEPKTGHWKRRIIDSGYNADWKCSECGHKEMTDFPTNYCPNCGAKMEGEQDANSNRYTRQ